jgi:hypothetical protein
MKNFLLKSIFTVFFLFNVVFVNSQTDSVLVSFSKECLCSNDPTPAGVMISHLHKKKEWMLSYRFMSMGMGGILKGTEAVSQNDLFVDYLMAPDKMRMDMHMVMGMYGITDQLTSMVMFNYNINKMDMSMFPQAEMDMPEMHSHGSSLDFHSMNTSGFSDVKLHLMYGLINRSYHQLLISVGLSLPLGSVQIKGSFDDMMYPNKRLPYAMQLGSGTLDVLPCLNYLFQKNKVTFSSQISGAIRTFLNSVGYKLGEEVVSNSWFAYNWLKSFSSSFRIEASSLGVITGSDNTIYKLNEISANPINYGGQKVSGFVGSSIQFKKGFLKNNRLTFEYGIPMYQKLNGIQMKINHSLFASWSYAF